jgi:hypothetical protein
MNISLGQTTSRAIVLSLLVATGLAAAGDMAWAKPRHTRTTRTTTTTDPTPTPTPVPTLAPTASFYVSLSGNDSNSGTSPSSPWRTIAKVNQQRFASGNVIYFGGGQTFSGKLYFGPGSSGTPTAPITISSYGTGRATIYGGTDSAMFIYNVAGFDISNINFVGSGMSSNASVGVSFYTDLSGNVKLSHVHFDQVEVSGFGGNGIALGGWNGTSGFADVRITNSKIHDDKVGGIVTYGALPYANSNVYIGHVEVYNSPGNPTATIQGGSGIILGSVDNGVIERSVAHGNGSQNTSVSGPAGIWTYDSNNITIQFNESYNNQTQNGDGDGFDLDGGTTNSVMQYNYSHDNDGAGFLLCQYAGAQPHSGNVVRYNISQNDARTTGYGAIHVYSTVSNAEVYNNIVYVSPASRTPSAIHLSNWNGSNLHFRNNVLIATGGVPLLVGNSGTGLLFQGNDYWTIGSGFLISLDSSTYYNLSDWQNNAGQERLSDGTPVGFNVDPALLAPGTGGIIGNADLLSSLVAYQLMNGSPLIDTGLNLNSPFGISPGSQDFYGNSLPQGSGYDVGVYERAY